LQGQNRADEDNSLEVKRVLAVGMSPHAGGIETFLYRSIAALQILPLRFDILTACERCAYEKELEEMGVGVFHVARRGNAPLRSYLDKRRFFVERGRAYDAIWLHVSSASDISVIRLAKKYTHARIICHSHSVSFESRGGIVRAVHMVLHQKNRAELVKLCDVCLAVTKEAGDWLYGDIDDRLVVIKNGADTEKFRFDTGIRRAARQSLNLEEKTVIGHVGRLVPVKNQRFLIDAFAAFHRKHRDSVLLIAGDGELYNELLVYAAQIGLSESIRFLGFRNDIPALLQAFDVFVLPSLFEGFPLVLVEAQSAALPCIASESITKSVAATQYILFCPLDAPPEIWAKEMENALRLRRDATGVHEALERAGLTEAAAQKRLFSILYGEETP
jgi:glycosyltransferase involved in cell wall biosynthesis